MAIEGQREVEEGEGEQPEAAEGDEENIFFLRPYDSFLIQIFFSINLETVF